MAGIKKILLIGTGQMAAIYARVLKDFPATEIIGVVGSTQDKAKIFAKTWNLPNFYGSDEFFKFGPANKEADGYILATSEWIRLEYLKTLGALGYPVLVEKPLLTSLADLKTLKEGSGFNPDLFTVVHSLRLSPRFTSARNLIRQNKIGEIRHCYARRNPSRQSVKRVLGKFDLSFWLSCHDIDLMSWMMESRVKEVTAFSRGKLDSEDDFILAHLHFENGAHAVSEVSWCSPPLSPTVPSCLMSIRGNQGQIEVNDSDLNTLAYLEKPTILAEDTYECYELAGGVIGGIFKSVVESWLKSSSHQKPGFCTFQEAENTLRVCDAISRSLRTKSTIPVSYV